MFFSKAARILAILAIVFSIVQVVLGILAATVGDGSAQARYGAPGHVIDRGIYTTLFAIALATLTEISFQIKRVHDKL